MYVYTQLPKDWQLLLAVGVIVLVDMCFSVPLITMANLDWDFAPAIDKENAPSLNVSSTAGRVSTAVDPGVNVHFNNVLFQGKGSFGEVLYHPLWKSDLFLCFSCTYHHL